MAQGKTTVVGFRRYEVLNIKAVGDFNDESHEFHADRVESIMILAGETVKIKFGKPNNDAITIPKDMPIQLPIKAKEFWVKRVEGVEEIDVEIIGFLE